VLVQLQISSSGELAIHQKANLEFANPPAYGKQGHAAMANKKPKKILPNTLAIKHIMQRETLQQLPNKYKNFS
jgi:hypothetical protein